MRKFWKNVVYLQRDNYLLILHWHLECRFKCVLNERIACRENGIADQERVVRLTIGKKPLAPALLQVRTARSAVVEVIAFVARVGVEKKTILHAQGICINEKLRRK